MLDAIPCKLCKHPAALPTFRLHKSVVYCCPLCDFHFLDHLDNLDAAETSTLDDRTRRLIEAKLVDNARLHRIRLAFVARHATPAQAQCLDIGAGVGYYPHLLAEAGASVRGLEPSSSNRAFALERFGLTLEPFRLDQPRWLTEQRESFDQVTLWDVIEHVNDPLATLTAAFTVLKPGGWLFLDTPSRDSLYYRISALVYRASQGRNPRLLNTLYSSVRYGHKQIFRPRQLAQLLQQTGFAIVTLRGHHDLPLPGPPALSALCNAVAGLARPKDKIVIACRKVAAGLS